MPISPTYNPQKPLAMLMRGRPDEPNSHQAIGVYSQREYDEYRSKGWKPAKVFMAQVERAMRKDN